MIRALVFLLINSIKNGGITLCIKRLEERLMSRDFDHQVNEVHARIAVLNIFTALGRPHTQVVS